MAPQVAGGLALLMERRRYADAYSPRSEDTGGLSGASHQLVVGSGHFAEIEAPTVEGPTPLQIFDREMKRIEPNDPERWCRHEKILARFRRLRNGPNGMFRTVSEFENGPARIEEWDR
jgi:hypothetical protein